MQSCLVFENLQACNVGLHVCRSPHSLLVFFFFGSAFRAKEPSITPWQQVDLRKRRKSGKRTRREERDGGKTEAAAAASQVGELKGAERVRKSVFYVGGIDVRCPEGTLENYCRKRNIRKVAGSIPTIGDFHTIGPCKKAAFACLATDVKEDTFTFTFTIRVASCGLLPSNFFGTKSARLIVSEDDAENAKITGEEFWPENVRVRAWKFCAAASHNTKDE